MNAAQAWASARALRAWLQPAPPRGDIPLSDAPASAALARKEAKPPPLTQPPPQRQPHVLTRAHPPDGERGLVCSSCGCLVRRASARAVTNAGARDLPSAGSARVGVLTACTTHRVYPPKLQGEGTQLEQLRAPGGGWAMAAPPPALDGVLQWNCRTLLHMHTKTRMCRALC